MANKEMAEMKIKGRFFMKKNGAQVPYSVTGDAAISILTRLMAFGPSGLLTRRCHRFSIADENVVSHSNNTSGGEESGEYCRRHLMKIFQHSVGWIFKLIHKSFLHPAKTVKPPRRKVFVMKVKCQNQGQKN